MQKGSNLRGSLLNVLIAECCVCGEEEGYDCGSSMATGSTFLVSGGANNSGRIVVIASKPQISATIKEAIVAISPMFTFSSIDHDQCCTYTQTDQRDSQLHRNCRSVTTTRADLNS